MASMVTINSFYTVMGASDAELRFLTVENGGSSDETAAIYNPASVRLTHVTAIALGDGVINHGVRNEASSPTMTHVTASASREIINVGVLNNGSSSQMTHVTAEAWEGSDNYGVFNDGSQVVMTDVTAAAERNPSYGVYNSDSSVTIRNSTISASRGTTHYGIYNTACAGTCIVRVDNSQITGSANTICNSAGFNTYVGASQLDGGAVSAGGGAMICYGCYDEGYTNSSGIGACP